MVKHETVILQLTAPTHGYIWMCACGEVGPRAGRSIHRGQVLLGSKQHERKGTSKYPDHCALRDSHGCTSPRDRDVPGGWCAGHGRRVRKYGSPFAHIPIGSVRNLAHRAGADIDLSELADDEL